MMGCPFLRLILVASFFLLSGVKTHSLEIDRVIVSSDVNPMYLGFWKVVAPLWSAMGIKPTLALIAEDDVEVDEQIGDVLRFNPLPDIKTSLQAQVIRLVLPALFPDEVSLISDIDMLPLSKEYFVRGAASCPEHSFLVYRDLVFGTYPMCYVAGYGRVFAAIFGAKDRDEIASYLKWAHALQLGWGTDEILLRDSVHRYQDQGGQVVFLMHPVYGRLDRAWWWHYDYHTLDIKGFVDCHCPRPYEEYKESIDAVTSAVLKSLHVQ